MRVLVPTQISLVSANVEEDSTPLWDETTTYNSGDVVKELNVGENNIEVLYTSLADNNIGKRPSESPEVWGDLGGTNKYKFLDKFVNTQTVKEDGNLELIINVYRADSVGLFNISGDKVRLEGTDVYGNIFEKEILLREYVNTFYDFFFAPIDKKKDIYIALPILINSNLKITIEGTGDTGLGCCVAGQSKFIGETLWGVKPGVRDFSIKTRDDFGKMYLKQGDFAKELEADLFLRTEDSDRVIKILEEIRGKAVVFEANNESTRFESLIVYGFLEDFDVTLKNYVQTIISIRIEGLI